MTAMNELNKHSTDVCDMSYAESFLHYVYLELDDIKKSFFKIGFRLNEANKYKYYDELGYSSIAELAEDKFGFKKSTTYDLMAIYELAHDNMCPMSIDKSFEGFSQSQLVAMTRVRYAVPDFVSLVKPTDSVKNIEKLVSLWNKKYVYGCGYRPGCNTVSDYLKKYEEEDSGAPATYPNQLKGQLAIELPEDTKSQKYSTQDIIDECLKRDRYKIEIYNKYCENPSRKDFIDYIKKLHGNLGETWRYGQCFFRNYSPSKGIELNVHEGDNIVISWAKAASRIRELIYEQKYRTEDELGLNKDNKSKLLDWQEKAREAAHAAGLPFYAGDPEEFDPYVFDGNMSVEDYNKMWELREADENSRHLENSENESRTNLEYLRSLSSDNFASVICRKVKEFVLKNNYCFTSVDSKLSLWLEEQHLENEEQIK